METVNETKSESQSRRDKRERLENDLLDFIEGAVKRSHQPALASAIPADGHGVN